VTKGTAKDTLTAPYNNLEAVEELVTANKDEVAAIIIEPVPGNMGCIIPEKGFLEGLRKLCTDNSIVLIFDEVMTGFRLSFGGAQALLGIDADLMTYGKIIGAGMPVGAYGGKQEIMDVIAPVGPVYQAGTLSGNPLAMIAGYTLLKELLEHPEYYNELSEKTAFLKKGWTEILSDKGISHSINQLGSMISLHFGDGIIRDFESSKESADKGLIKTFFHAMMNGGVYLPPSAYESCFLSNALSQEDLDKTLEVTKEAVSQLSISND
jgi:glutamate-1-semialdehyde 2,1-aminomutase